MFSNKVCNMQSLNLDDLLFGKTIELNESSGFNDFMVCHMTSAYDARRDSRVNSVAYSLSNVNTIYFFVPVFSVFPCIYLIMESNMIPKRRFI